MSGPWEKYQAAPDQASAAAPAPAADGPWTRYATPSAAAPAKSDSQSLGESQPGIVKAAISTLQGPAMGFADELAGVGGAITGAIANLTPYGDGKTFAENYKGTRDAARAASDSHMKENPVLGHVERIAASLPVIAATPVIQGVQKGGSFLSAVPESIKAGVKFGAIAGAGDSTATDVAGIAKDSAASAAAGGVLGPIVSGIVRAGGAVASNIGQQIASSPTGRTMLDTIKEIGVGGNGGGGIVSAALPGADGGSRKFAMQKIAEAVERDKPGLVNPLDIIAARQNRLGSEATIADSAGQNTKQLLDTLATLPGQTKDGRGSQTAARAAGMGDVDMAAVTEAGNIARSAATGNVPGMLGSATNLWNRVKTPEAVRDQMGEILMAKGQQGAQNITEIKRIAEQIKQEKARRAAQAGTFAGLL